MCRNDFYPSLFFYSEGRLYVCYYRVGLGLWNLI